MMNSNEKIKIQITREEWFEADLAQRIRIKELMAEKGYAIDSLIQLEEEDDMICPYCDGSGCDVCGGEE